MSEIPEHTTEPVPGLPEQLPRNEKILWQGKPDWLQFAIHATHARKLAIYFGALLVWRLVTEPGGGHGKFLALSVLGVGIIVLLAWLMTRSALYTITDRRVVMRFGVAIPISINLPFADIASAQLRQVSRASGDILLVARSAPANRLSYLICWPHVRPWHISVVQPMMRCLANAGEVAAILRQALQTSVATTPEAAVAPKPATPRPLPRGAAFPLPPLLGAGALLAITLLSVGWLQLAGERPKPAPLTNVVASVQLQFEDRADGSVLVLDADSGAQIDELPAGTNNFLRATLRGLVRGRHAADADGRPPFGLYQTADGRLLLVDPVSGEQVDLWAFGESNAAAFAAFLPNPLPAPKTARHQPPGEPSLIENTLTSNNSEERLP